MLRLLMVVLLVAKPVEGWCSVAASQLLNLLSIGARNLTEPKPAPKKDEKEEKIDKKEQELLDVDKRLKEKSEVEKKRSGGYVRAADGIAKKGKTRGRMV